MADCRVRSGRLVHFLDTQWTIWDPGMLDAGALSAWPLRDRASAAHIVVISLWPSTETHDRYRRERFADLRRRAEPDTDLVQLEGWSAALEPAWTVLSP